MKKQIFFWSLVSVLAGFLFGFDTVVISGAEKTIQTLWELGAGLHGIAMASALYGTVLGSLFGGWPTDRFGRKKHCCALACFTSSRPWAALLPTVLPCSS
jgi:MFS family permease